MMGIGIHMMKMNVTGVSGKGTMPSVPCCLELGPERRSRTENLDPAYSHMNAYHMPAGVTTGAELAQWLEDEFQAANAARRSRGQRANRADCDRAATFTLAPDEASLALLTHDEQVGLARAMVAGLEDYIGHPVDAWAVHFDEGTHPGRNINVHVVDRMLAAPDTYALTRVVGPGWLKRMHDVVPGAIEARLPASVLEKVGGVEVHLSEEEHRRRGDVPRRGGRHANEYAAAQAIVHAAEDEAEDVRLSAAGEAEAVRQATDRATDRLEAASEAAEEAERQARLLQAGLTDHERRRQEAEEAARAAEERARRAEDEAARAVEERAAELAGKAEAEAAKRSERATRRAEADEAKAAEARRKRQAVERDYRRAQKAVDELSATKDRLKQAKADAKAAERAAASATKRADKARERERSWSRRAKAMEESVKPRKERAEAELADLQEQIKQTRAYRDAIDVGDGWEWGTDGVGPRFHERSVAEAKAERAAIEREAKRLRGDLTARGESKSFPVTRVIAVTLGVVADGLEAAGMGRAADWLRGRSDEMRERVLDRLAPETRRGNRDQATWEVPRTDDERQRQEGPER